MSDGRPEPGFMRAQLAQPRHWWGRRWPSVLALGAVLAISIGAVVVLAGQAAEVLPEVGKDQLGEDNWTDPLGVHLAADFQVARVPDCAAGAFTRFVLWDPQSRPYWEVEGPPTPINSFLVGVAPDGFKTVTPFRDPPDGALLRLVAFRRDGGPVGIRYRAADLRPNRVVSGNPLTRFTIEGFQKAEVCGGDEGDLAPEDTVDPDDQESPGAPTGGTPVTGPSGSTTTIDDGTGPTTEPGG